MKIKNSLKIVALALISSNLSVANASLCKELSQSTCNKMENCRWIKEYQRKDGKSVRAYCRKSSVKTKKNQDSISIPPKRGHYRNYEDRWLIDK